MSFRRANFRPDKRAEKMSTLYWSWSSIEGYSLCERSPRSNTTQRHDAKWGHRKRQRQYDRKVIRRLLDEDIAE